MYTLDLHGVVHEDVESKCHRFINKHWNNQLTIITGHSPAMKSIVCKVLEHYSLQYIVGGITGSEGYIKIFSGGINV